MRQLAIAVSVLAILINLAIWLKLDAVRETSEKWYVNCLNSTKARE